MAHIGMVLIGDIRYDGRVRKEIGTLVKAGHDVELIVSDFKRSNCGGEELGIRIHYIPMILWSRPTRNFLEQLLFNYKAASIIKELAFTHIHCHDLSSLLAGVWAKRKARNKLVFDAHELMPESMGGIKRTIWDYIEKRCIRNCDYIILPEENRIFYFREKYQHIPKPLLLENFPRKSDIPPEKCNVFRAIYPIRREQKIVLYSGTIGPDVYIEEMINSIVLCGKQVALVILGRSFKNYEEILRAKIQSLYLDDRIFIHGPVLHTAVLKYMASCDIGTVFYRNTDLNNYFCAPNKLYEYIALDKPLLTNNYPGLLKRVENFGQGICLPEVTPNALAEAYVSVTDTTRITPGARKFFWEDQAAVLLRLYK